MFWFGSTWKKYPRYNAKRCSSMQTYLRLEGLEGGGGGTLLGRGEGGGASDEGEGSELEHGWMKFWFQSKL